MARILSYERNTNSFFSSSFVLYLVFSLLSSCVTHLETEAQLTRKNKKVMVVVLPKSWSRTTPDDKTAKGLRFPHLNLWTTTTTIKLCERADKLGWQGALVCFVFFGKQFLTISFFFDKSLDECRHVDWPTPKTGKCRLRGERNFCFFTTLLALLWLDRRPFYTAQVVLFNWHHHHVLFHHLLVPPLPTFSFLIRRQTHVVRFLSLAVSAFFFRFSLLVFAQFLCAPTTHAPFTSNALLIWILPADELTSLLKLEETCRGCKWDTFQLLVYTKRKSPPTYRGITPGACTPFSFACGH